LSLKNNPPTSLIKATLVYPNPKHLIQTVKNSPKT
jgi:hypothetical protein